MSINDIYSSIPRNNKIILGVLVFLIIILIIFTYTTVNKKLIQELRENLIVTAYLGSLQVNGDLIENIETQEDIYLPEYKEISDTLNKIKASSAKIKYVYIMRMTKDPNIVEFVVDANNYLTVKNPDENNNGIIEKEEMFSLPGDLYEAFNMPELLKGFIKPTADYEIIQDKWGEWLSGYAPIKNSKGEFVAMLGIDMSAEMVKAVLGGMQRAIFLSLVIILIISAILYSLIYAKKREFEIQKETDRLKDDFFTKVSHELRTPIVAIIGFAELINEINKDLNKETQTHIFSIQTCCNRLLRKVNHLLDFAKIKATKVTVNKQEFYIKDLIYDIKDCLEFFIKENNLNLIINVNDTYKKIFADKEKIFDILTNLVSNAIKFTKSGGKITISAIQMEKALRLNVIDTGIGIPQKHLKNIFNDFTQLNTSSTIRQYKGSGLGLFIVKGLVELLKGQIDVKSSVGEGTIFTVTIPI
jgi:signal transduction histidine kinase